MTYTVGKSYRIAGMEMVFSHYWNDIPVFWHLQYYNGKPVQVNYIDHSLKG